MIRDGRWESAAGPLKSILGANPVRPEPYNLLAAVYEKGRDYTTARKLYRAALSLDPTYAPAQNNLTRLVQQPDFLQVFAAVDLGL